MKRLSLRLLLVAIAAVFVFGSLAEAAPRKVVHHRARHSTRVTSSASTRSKHRVRTKKKRRTRTSASSSRASKSHRPSTKPR
jgi:hypothetical protein